MGYDESVFKRAVDSYGSDMQQIVCVEELSELIQALCKEMRPHRRNMLVCRKQDILSIAEELSDVEIMLEQIKYVFDNKTQSGVRFSELVKSLKEMKIEKLENNITDYNNKMESFSSMVD